MFTTPEGLAPIVQPFFDLQLITALGDPIKSGKEATVFRRDGHARTGLAHLALKVYRPRSKRSFKNDARYRQGSMLERVAGGNRREARALRAGSRFGRIVGAGSWCAHEWEVMTVLHEADLPVPVPVHTTGEAILMELFTIDGERTAPPLADARLDAASAEWLFESLCRDIEDMLVHDLVHADLSPYNVLWNGHAYRIIDFPQAVDARFNPDAERLLLHDVQTVGRFCARFGTIRDPDAIAADLWQRYRYGEL